MKKTTEKQSQSGARDADSSASHAWRRNGNRAGGRASEKCVSRMICSLRHPPQELLEVTGPALLNLSAGSQTIAAQHEANDHA